jgi:ribosomal protein L37AE/L43A
MTSINDKLGLRRAGKRSMMKLPEDRALRNRVTSAHCPKCDRTGAQLSRLRAGLLFCTWCYHEWPLPPVEAGDGRTQGGE